MKQLNLKIILLISVMCLCASSCASVEKAAGGAFNNAHSVVESTLWIPNDEDPE